MSTGNPSEDTLIRDSQISGFSSFKERLGSCCCRVFKKSSSYNLSSASKDTQDEVDKPSYINQAYQIEKQARRDKIDKIAKTLPGATPSGRQEIRAPITTTQTPTRPLTTRTQETPRSAFALTKTRQSTATSASKTGISTMSKPSPSAANTTNKKKVTDETTTGLLSFSFEYFLRKKNHFVLDATTEEESSSEEENSSDSDSAPAKKPAPTKTTNKRR
jgi:hypothetical protein